MKDNEENAVEKSCCCQAETWSGKIKRRSTEEKHALITRLNRINGQIRGITNMVENDAYCVDILTQVASAQAALNSFSRVMLDTHIRTCVVEGVRSGDNEVLDELIETLRKFMK